MRTADTFFAIALPLIWVVLYCVFCGVVAHEATLRGRSRLTYFVLSLLLTPIFGGIILGLHGAAPGSPKALAAAKPK